MEPLPTQEEYGTVANPRRIRNRCQPKKDMEPLPTQEEYGTVANPRRIWNRCQHKKDMEPLPTQEVRQEVEVVTRVHITHNTDESQYVLSPCEVFSEFQY